MLVVVVCWRILGINIYEVKERGIRNGAIRQQFGEILDIGEEITYKQLKWIGKLMRRQPNTLVARRLLGAHVDNPRKRGRTQLNVQRTYVPALQELLPNLGKHAAMREWKEVTQNKKQSGTRGCRSGMRARRSKERRVRDRGQ
jgi:hypothetical protein